MILNVFSNLNDSMISPVLLHTSPRRAGGRYDASGSPGSSAPSPCGVKQDTKKHQHHSNQNKGHLSKEMLLPPGQRRCLGSTSSLFPGTLPLWGKLTQHGTSEVSAATQWKNDSTRHLQTPSPALQSLLDKIINKEADQGKDTARYAASCRN